MNPPFVPLMTGEVRKDVDRIVKYLSDLNDYLAARGVPSTGWVATGTVTDTTLTAGDTLAATQDVLGTLIQYLLSKGELAG